MLTRIEKIKLCGIEPIFLDRFWDFNPNAFETELMAKYYPHLPELYEYRADLFRYGIHLHNRVRSRENDKKNPLFPYIFSLLKEYKHLLEGHKDICVISPENDDNPGIGKINAGNYRRILMQGLDQELRRYDRHSICKTDEEINEEINKDAPMGEKWLWAKERTEHYLSRNVYLTKETANSFVCGEYRNKYPEYVEELTLEHINKTIEMAVSLNQDNGYFNLVGRPKNYFEHDIIQRLWLLLIIDEEIKSLHNEVAPRYNKSIRHRFIYEFMTYFRLYDFGKDVKKGGDRIRKMRENFNDDIKNNSTDIQRIKNRFNEFFGINTH